MTLEDYEKMLGEAQAALHALMTGTKTVEVTFPSGQSVRYTNADATDLRAYISYLIDMIEILGGNVQRRANRKPIRFGF